jgi:homocysteine S-methyltransferase
MSAITLLDGSIGQELVKRSGDRATPLWSTQVMIDHPELVEAVHAAYFAAGATVASTNTYAVLRDRLVRAGLQDQVDTLLAAALNAARAARDAHGAGRIAAALGPVGATYRPDLVVTVEDAAALYAPSLAALDSGVDLWLLETVASINHAQTALAAVKAKTGKPVWLSITLSDDQAGCLRSGEAVTEFTHFVSSLPAKDRPNAVLINCCRPEQVAGALPALATTGLPFGAYANGFTRISVDFLKEAPTVDALEARTDLTPEAYADFVLSWVNAGATIVGGCCEVGPDHIAEVARRLRAAGHTIV